MLFSKSCEYGLKATLFLAKNHSGNKTGIKRLADELEIPMPYLNKVLQILVKNGLISSSKGRNGGFFLTEREVKQPLIKIVQAIDGDAIFKHCGLGLKTCSSEQPCPLHDDIKAYRENLELKLSINTIEMMSRDIAIGITFLSR